MFHNFLFWILFVLVEGFFLFQDNCTFPKLLLLLKVFTLMGGMYWVDNYPLYYLFMDPSNRTLYGHASSIQADHLLLSIFYSFLRKHVGVGCWGSWFNILGHRLSLRLSSFVSFCIVSLFSEHLCSLFLEDAHHLLSLSLSSDLSIILPLCYVLFWYPNYCSKTLCIVLRLAHYSI